MAKQIKGSEIFEDGLFDVLKTGAEEAKKKVAELNEELSKTGVSFKKELKGSKPESIKEIEALMNSVKKLNAEIDKQIKLNTANERLQQQINKTLQEEEKAKALKIKTLEQEERLNQQSSRTKIQNIKLTQTEAKEEERLSKEKEKKAKLLKQENDAYIKLQKNTRELKNESKRLGAEMLALEQAGQKNSKEYARLSRTYKDVTASAKQGDEALKKLDARVGDNFRNVGNYEKGVARLKNVLSQLGLAFGGVTIIRNLIDTQVQLDSLKLALQNVSKSTNEYQANLSFLKDISNSYGQDLIVMIDSYKNFIASTESSNLSLKERKKVYESVIKAGSSLALTNDQMKGSLLAISQMFSKGAVSAEELRQQLGERLPGAFSIMAESMGVSEKKLAEMMKNGEVMADDVMPNFARALNEHFGENAKKRLETLGGAWNLLKNKVTEFVDTTQKGVGINKTFAFVLRAIAENIGTLLSSIRLVIQSYITYKGVLLGLQLIEKVRNGSLRESIMLSLQTTRTSKQMAVAQGEVATATSVASKEFRLFGMTLKSIGWMAVITALSVMAEKIWEVARGTEDAQKNFRAFDKGSSEGRKNFNEFMAQRDKEIKTEINKQKEILKTKKLTKEQYQDELREIKKSEDEKTKLKIREQIKYLNEKRVVAQGKLAKYEAQGGAVPLSGLDAFDFDKSATRTRFLVWQKERMAIDTELSMLNDEFRTISDSIDRGAGKAEKQKKEALEHVKAVKELEIEYKKVNDYLSNQLELLEQLRLIEAERIILNETSNADRTIQDQLEMASKTGKYSDRVVVDAIEAEKKARIKNEEEIYNFKLAQRQKEFDERQKQLKEDLEAEKQAQIEKVEVLKEKIKEKQRFVDANAKNERKGLLSESAKQSLQTARNYIKEQQQVLENEKNKSEIEAGYIAKRTKLEENAQKELENIRLADKVDLENKEKNKTAIVKEATEKALSFGEDAERRIAEFRLNQIKTLSQSIDNLIQKSLEHYINFAERRIQNLEAVMNKTQNQIDFMQQKAVAGSIQATESLAELDKQQIEDQKKKMQEQKNIQKLQIAMTIFQAYANNIQNAEVGENPFTKTLTDVTKLTALIASVPTFYEGTETTVADALGTPQLQGKDGYLVRVDGAEKVLNPTLSKMTGNMTTMEIAKLAEDKLRGNIIHKGEGAIQLMNNSWSTDVIVSELQDLKNVIKNKPEYSAQVGEIIGGVMHVVETKKVGNTRVRDITRFS